MKDRALDYTKAYIQKTKCFNLTPVDKLQVTPGEK